MEFTKKFYLDTINEYVGVSEGKVYKYYDINNEEVKINDPTYYSNILLSNKNFNRDFTHRLELPYKKHDVQLAANDFFYSSTLNDIINKLQLNNEYIYRNNIIADGKLFPDKLNPYINEQASVSEAKYDVKTADNKIKTYKIKKNNGAWSDSASNTIFLEKNTGGYKEELSDKPNNKYDLITKEWIKNLTANSSAYEKYHYLFKTEKCISLNTLSNSTFSAPLNPNNNDIFKSTTSITAVKNDNKKINIMEFACSNDKFDNQLRSIIESLIEDEKGERINTKYSLYLRLDSISFLTNVKTNIEWIRQPHVANDYSSSGYVSIADDGVPHNEHAYGFVSQQELTGGNYINTIYFSNRNYFTGKNGFKYKISIDKSISVDSILDNIKKLRVTIRPTKADIRYSPSRYILNYSLSINDNDNISLSDFEYLPNYIKQSNYRFIWNNGDNPPSNMTYGELKNSKEWIAGGNTSSLEFKAGPAKEIKDDPKTEDKDEGYTSTYIPEDNMTAFDVHNYLINCHIKYTHVPKLEKLSDTYKQEGFVKNPLYRPRNYPLMTYDWVQTSKTSDAGQYKLRYKTAKEIWEDLEFDIKNSTAIKRPDCEHNLTIIEKIFDNKPVVKEEISIDSSNSTISLPDFDYLDINDSAVIKNNDNTFYFIAFSNKILILIYKNEDLESKDKNSITPIVEITIKDIKSYNINYSFKNIHSILIKDNDLYITDSKLNAVIHCGIEHLMCKNFNNKSEDGSGFNELIIFKNILQGDGKAKDKLCFDNPTSIAVSSSKVYITDKNNKCIKIYNRNLNYIKTIKNGKYSTQNIEAIAINPNALYLENGTKIKSESLWVISKQISSIFLSIYVDEELVYNTPLSNIKLENNINLWEDSVKNIIFSFSDSNYYYIVTTYNIYKLYTSKPTSILGSYKYEKSTRKRREKYYKS